MGARWAHGAGGRARRRRAGAWGRGGRSMTVNRRGLLAGVTALAAASLAGCRSSPDDGRLATEAHASVSPSGEFSALIAGAADGLHPMIRDRKSTRLNSSHVAI